MKIKETTYQRLKRENQELRQKLSLLVHASESPEAIALKQEVILQKNIEDAVWQGDTISKSNERLIKAIATW